DWVYLNNFRRQHRPKPYRLPAGIGRRVRDRLVAIVPQLRDTITAALASDVHQERIRAEREKAREEIARRIEALRHEAEASGFELAQGAQATIVLQAAEKIISAAAELPPDKRSALEASAKRLSDALTEINRWATQRQAELLEWSHEHDREAADLAIQGLLDELRAEFGHYRGLARWLTEMHVDILDNLDLFRPKEGEAGAKGEPPERHYGINLLVDHGDDAHPSVVLEANPSYENLFGRMEYRQIEGMLQTDFTLIQAGSLHRANGGILVLRAESIAGDPLAWQFLKGALRDHEIRVEELHRAGSVPVAGAPRPKPIPLDIKVAVVGAPRWYYSFFSTDPDFQTYFKVKADIDADMDATPANLGCYAGLIQRMAEAHGGAQCEAGAIKRLLGVAARWSAQRNKLTARFELIEDLVSEAALLCDGPGARVIPEQAVVTALLNRRRRNARAEDRMQETIARGTLMIDTAGAVVGQVNALTVRDLGDYSFGSPARVTARASVGRRGVINIERDVALGGPIQQKGVMVLQGFLAGHFARLMPLSFNCSITFEQNYGEVEGDSASLAELLATLSDLSGVPLRQDLAVTGSVNQRGQAQAVGGVHHKVEGFFRTCLETSGLSGSQGVVIPAANELNIVLHDEVAEAVAQGRFHILSVSTVEDALEVLTGASPGELGLDGAYPADSLYGRVTAQLQSFDRILAERERGAG
ncbi:MAG: Lon protease family protein, partial [Alphaproteobacteria bacterium]